MQTKVAIPVPCSHSTFLSGSLIGSAAVSQLRVGGRNDRVHDATRARHRSETSSTRGADPVRGNPGRSSNMSGAQPLHLISVYAINRWGCEPRFCVCVVTQAAPP